MGLGRKEKDKTYGCHERYYTLLEQQNHDIGLIENVSEYQEHHATQNLPSNWGCVSEVIDPRLFGCGCARPRRYMILWDKTKVQWRSGMVLRDVLECLRATPCVSAKHYFWMKLPEESLTHSQEPPNINLVQKCSMDIGSIFTAIKFILCQ